MSTEVLRYNGAADGYIIDVGRYDESTGKFLYSAESSPQGRSKSSTLYYPDIHVLSDTISTSY